jgi:hypothetical protein
VSCSFGPGKDINDYFRVFLFGAYWSSWGIFGLKFEKSTDRDFFSSSSNTVGAQSISRQSIIK